MRIVHLRAEIPGTRTIPTEIRLLRKGINPSTKGDFLYDDLAEDLVMADSRRRGVDFCFDYDHSAESTPESQAIAAGWFSLEARADGLYATRIRWTERARAYLAAAEYRYVSPWLSLDESTGRVLRVLNVALVNAPALFDAPALVAASLHPIGGPPMRTSSPSDDLALRAYIASKTGGTLPAVSQVALSSLAGTASKRAALAMKSDEQILAEAHPMLREIIERTNVGTKAQGAAARSIVLNNLNRADRETTEALVEQGRVLAQGSR